MILKQLLSTKIEIPPLPTAMVARPRLYAMLDRGFRPNTRLTLLSTPAGYGKTTLLSAWLRARKVPAAWVSLDKDDDDAMRWSNYLLGAFHRAYPQTELPWPLPQGLHESDLMEGVLIPFINTMGRSATQQIIVIDDYHLIQNQSVHDALTFLLEHLPPQGHIVLAARADPPLPLARLRGRGQINELRMQDLRFSQEEVIAFLRCFKDIDLPEADAELLVTRTEGWISGIQMAAASMRGLENSSAFVHSLSGSHHYIMDYLLEEVLRRQPPPLQVFLQGTSILNRMCGPLCEAVLEDASWDPGTGRQLLRELEGRNLFIVPLDENREWYRYHRLFADLLQARLHRTNPQALPSLHARACAWFARNGYPGQAIEHAIAGGDPTGAADLVEGAAQDVLMRHENATFLHWIAQLPEEEILQRPKLGVYRAWSLILQGAPVATIEALIADGALEKGPAGSTESLHSFLALLSGKIQEAMLLSDQALQKLPLEETYLRDLATLFAGSIRASLGMEEEGTHILLERSETLQQSGDRIAAGRILCELAELRSREMRLKDAEGLFRKALSFCTDDHGHYTPLAGQALIGLGELALERFELNQTHQFLQQGMSLIKGWSILNTFNGLIALVMLYELEGDGASLQETMDTLSTLARQMDFTEIDDILVELLEAKIKVRAGDLQAARNWSQRRGLDQGIQQLPSEVRTQVQSRFHKYELPVLAQLRLAEGRPQEAIEIVEEVIRRAEQFNRPYLQLIGLLLRALAFNAMGLPEHALENLQRALLLGVREKPIYVFLIEGGEIERLLGTLRPNLQDRALRGYADQLLDAFSALARLRKIHQGKGADLETEPLSAREMDVLRLLPSDLTAQGLAEELYLSVNTIRSHMKSIYAKLGVHSRHQAVARSLELGIL